MRFFLQGQISCYMHHFCAKIKSKALKSFWSFSLPNVDCSWCSIHFSLRNICINDTSVLKMEMTKSVHHLDKLLILVLIITEKKLNELQANTNMLWFISFKNINESKTTKHNLALSPIVPIKCNWRYQIDVNYKMNRNVFIFVVKLFKSSPISGSYNHTSGNSSLFESDKVHKTIT